MFRVIVGNVGIVMTTENHDDKSMQDAKLCFSEYVNLSKAYYGRCAGENVVLMDVATGDIIEEYFAPVSPDPQSV